MTIAETPRPFAPHIPASTAWHGRAATWFGRYGMIVFGLSAVLMLMAGVRYTISDQFNQAEQSARQNGANLARAFEEQIIRSIRAADQTILYVRETYARAPEKFDISLWAKNSQFLTDFSFQVAVIDANGYLLVSNIDPASRVNLSDREHFRVHAQGDNDFLFISKPVFGRVSGKWSIQLTRRIIMADGSFGGVVVVSLDPGYLSRFYESVDMGDQGTVSLVGIDGIVRARGTSIGTSTAASTGTSIPSNNPASIGESVAGGKLLASFAKAPAGDFYNSSPLDRIERLYSYREVKGYPLLVVVGQAKDEIFHTFAKNREHYILAATAIGLWILAVTGLIVRYQHGLSRARDAAEAGTRARSEFLAMMSHEIRTPINGVVGMADLLTETPLNAEQQRMAGTLRDSAEHLLQILNDVLDFTKIEADRLEFETIRFEPRQIVRASIDAMAPAASDRKIGLRMDVSVDVPECVTGDPARLRQVLFNLIGNGIKFTERGEVVVAVSGAAIDEVKYRLDFEVRDTGVGIPTDAIKNLFREFSQLDSSISRRFGGTGLGLAICKRLVHGMGGTISAESIHGQGSTFRFSILVDRADADTRSHGDVSPDEQSGMPAVPMRPLRVLLAEDNATNQLVACKMLKALGHDARVVANGAEAVAAVRSWPFDVVLMDVMMPEMDGLAATRAIRSLSGAERNIPIIALTANAMRDDVTACRAAGMNDILAKPITRERLAAAMARLPSLPRSEALSLEARPILDRGTFDGLAADLGDDSAREILDTFLVDTNTRIALIGDLSLDDRQQIRREAHAMKSSAATLGFMHLSALARGLETDAVVLSAEELPARLETINRAFAEAAALVRDQMKAA